MGDEGIEGGGGEKFYYDKCAALFYGSHYRPTSGRHCESVENNEVEMQFTLVLRRSKLESLLPSQICLSRILILHLTIRRLYKRNDRVGLIFFSEFCL